MKASSDVRVWFATERDYAFCLYLCKKFRNNEFFYVPDESLKTEIRKGNIIAFDYRSFEAGYIWVTFPKSGRSRINQLAVDEQLWRNKVGTLVVSFFESHARKNGCWAVYLSCNTNTPGHNFWPTVGYTQIVEKVAGRRGGMNIIWAKLLHTEGHLFAPSVWDVKSADSYQFQNSISNSKKSKSVNENRVMQMSLLVEFNKGGQ